MIKNNYKTYTALVVFGGLIAAVFVFQFRGLSRDLEAPYYADTAIAFERINELLAIGREEEKRSVVQIRIDDTSSTVYAMVGSGIYLGEGRILTNYHVAEKAIEDMTRYMALICIIREPLPMDCGFKASMYPLKGTGKQAQYSKKLDLAVLNIGWRKNKDNQWTDISVQELENVWRLKPMRYSEDQLESISMGDKVWTLGFPGGIRTVTSSEGVVTKFWESGDHEVSEYSDNVVLIGTDAKIAEGSSGGAAFDASGKFIGITMATREDKEVQTTGVIPVAVIRSWLELEEFSASSDTERCPDDYTNAKDMATAFEIWMNKFYNANPSASFDDMALARRNYYKEHNCAAALQRLNDFDTGRVDSKTLDELKNIAEDVIN